MNTITEKPLDPLARFAEQINPLRALKAKHDQEVADNRRKLAEAEAERADYQQSGPPDEALVRKLAESHIRVELYRNHQVKLETRAVELLTEAEQVTARYALELNKAAVNCESLARQQLVAAVGRLVSNGEKEIVQCLNAYGLGQPLISHEERSARALRAAAEYRRGEGEPFRAFDEMQDAWREFLNAIEQAQRAKSEPLLSVPA